MHNQQKHFLEDGNQDFSQTRKPHGKEVGKVKAPVQTDTARGLKSSDRTFDAPGPQTEWNKSAHQEHSPPWSEYAGVWTVTLIRFQEELMKV